VGDSGVDIRYTSGLTISINASDTEGNSSAFGSALSFKSIINKTIKYKKPYEPE